MSAQLSGLLFYTGVPGFLPHSDIGVIKEPVAGPEGGLAQVMAVRRCHFCLHPEVWAGVVAVLVFLAWQVVMRDRGCAT